MRIKIFFVILGLLIITLVIIGNNFENTSYKDPLETYSLVKINITTSEDIMKLQSNDITVEHYHGNIEEGIKIGY